MPKLSYFVAECLDDNQCYNLRAKTKKECLRLLAENDACGASAAKYGPVHRVDVFYQDAFDLACLAMGEGRIYEGERAEETSRS